VPTAAAWQERALVSKDVSHVSLSSIAMSIEITDDVIKSGMTSLKVGD